jgi:hypothetical protein
MTLLLPHGPWIFLALCLWAVPCAAQTASPATPDASATPPPSMDELPWAVQLGLRSLAVQQAVPWIDQVVLVPDAATYLDELSKWSPRGRWPVLFADDLYAPKFIRAFEPTHVYLREPVGETNAEAQDRRERIEQIVIDALRPEGMSAPKVIADFFRAVKYKPPGVVVMSLEDPAWTAGVALAAGRGQPILWLDANYRNANVTLEHAAAMQLAADIERQIAALGFDFAQLGDDIDTITVCHVLPCKVNLESRGTHPVPAPPPHDKGPIAITDLIGRNASFDRYAFTGWIYGDETRSAYVAMSSLFLHPKKLAAIHTYPEEPGWRGFALDEGADLFTQRGITVDARRGMDTTAAKWLQMIMRGTDADMIWVNTHGSVIRFEMHRGTCFAVDVPVLHRPAAVHFVHSWSFKSPMTESTIAAQWLEHGAVAYVGSSHEPLLGAFVPPKALAQRCLSAVPYLIAARHWTGPYAGPWRINTYGDPLMLHLGPSQWNVTRRDPSDQDQPTLKAMVQAALEQLQNDDADDDDFAHAARLLRWLCRDQLAIGLWHLAQQRGHEPAVAHLAMEAAFRAGDRAMFMDAWNHLPHRDHAALDMLWHLNGPVLAGMDDEQLLIMQSAIRPDGPYADLARLAPYLSRRFGAAHVRSVIDRESERVTRPWMRNELDKIRRQY